MYGSVWINLADMTKCGTACAGAPHLSGPGSSSGASWCASPGAPGGSWSRSCCGRGKRRIRTPRWSCPSCPRSSCCPRCTSHKAPPAGSPLWSSSQLWLHLPETQRRCRWQCQAEFRARSRPDVPGTCHEAARPGTSIAGSRRTHPGGRRQSWQKRRSRPRNTQHRRKCQLLKVCSRSISPPTPFFFFFCH